MARDKEAHPHFSLFYHTFDQLRPHGDPYMDPECMLMMPCFR